MHLLKTIFSIEALIAKGITKVFGCAKQQLQIMGPGGNV